MMLSEIFLVSTNNHFAQETVNECIFSVYMCVFVYLCACSHCVCVCKSLGNPTVNLISMPGLTDINCSFTLGV